MGEYVDCTQSVETSYLVAVGVEVPCKTGEWAICMELFVAEVPCKTGEWAICMELFVAGVPCKTRKWLICMELFVAEVPCKTGEWAICMELFVAEVPCKTRKWLICMELFNLSEFQTECRSHFQGKRLLNRLVLSHRKISSPDSDDEILFLAIHLLTQMGLGLPAVGCSQSAIVSDSTSWATMTGDLPSICSRKWG